MPFLTLPSDDAQLRYADDPIVLHYLVSTPDCRTFAAAQTHASKLAASLSSSSNLAASDAKREVKLDARYPIVLFLPSECFSVAHLFADQLSDSTLSAHFNLVAVDPRGHGLTREVPIRDPSTRKYDLDIKAADVLAFIRLLLSPYQPANGKEGEICWAKGIHILACSMSGLVAARMAAQWPDTFTSIMITSPILELESPFMVESFQGIKELLTESWHQQHSQRSHDVRLPGEVVQGFTFRWAGSETIPAHIASYLSRTWLERLVLHHQGLEAARDWWFDLYWLRKPMPESARCAVRCDLLVVEGDRDLPYDRNVADDIAALFPNAGSVHVHKVPRAPFLLSVKRPSQLTDAICSFLGVESDTSAYSEDASMDALMALDEDERFELVKVYAPQLVPDSDSDADSDDDQDEEQAESDTDPEEAFDSLHPLRTKRAGFGPLSGRASQLGERTLTAQPDNKSALNTNVTSHTGNKTDGRALPAHCVMDYVMCASDDHAATAVRDGSAAIAMDASNHPVGVGMAASETARAKDPIGLCSVDPGPRHNRLPPRSHRIAVRSGKPAPSWWSVEWEDKAQHSGAQHSAARRGSITAQPKGAATRSRGISGIGTNFRPRIEPMLLENWAPRRQRAKLHCFHHHRRRYPQPASPARQLANTTTNTLGRLSFPRHTFVITTTVPPILLWTLVSTFHIWAVAMSETATATRPPAKPLRNASPARSTAKHHLEPNPFEKSFSSGPTSSESIDRRSDLKSESKSSLSTPPLSTRPGAAYRDRTFSKSQTSPSTTNNDAASTPKPLLPPVASITSPAGESNAYPWSAGLTSSLRSGPLSPAMLAGPQSSHFDPNSFRTGFTPDLSNFKTGLTPLSGGMSFPPPSPNTAAFLAAMVNNTSAPSTSAAAITPNTLNALTNAAASATGSIDPNAPNAPTAPGAALSTQPQNFAGKPSDAHNAFDLAFSRSFPNDRAAAEAKAGSKLKAQVKASDSDRSLSQSISPQMVQKPLDAVPGDQQNAASGLFLLSRAHQEMAKRDGAAAASTSLYESKPAAAAASKKGAKGKGEDAKPANNKRKKSNSTEESVAPAAASSSSSASIGAPPAKTVKTAKGGKKAAASSSSMKDFGPPDDDDEEHWDSDDDGKGEKGQDEKRKNFLERNRQAALKCRQRKKAWLASLQAKVEYLQNDNENLQNTVGALRNENMFLKSQLVQATGGAPLPMMPMMPMAPPPPHGVEHMQMMPHPAYMHPGASGPPMSQAQAAFVPPAQVHVPRAGMAPGFEVQRQRQRTDGDQDAGAKHEREWSNASDVSKQQSGPAATIKV